MDYVASLGIVPGLGIDADFEFMYIPNKPNKYADTYIGQGPNTGMVSLGEFNVKNC